MKKPSKDAQENPDDREKLLTVAEVSDLLGVPITTIYAWRYHGEGPQGYKIGRHVRYRWSSVEAWLDGHADQWAA